MRYVYLLLAAMTVITVGALIAPSSITAPQAYADVREGKI